MMMNILSVAIGGACGAMLRYAVGLLMATLGQPGWLATISVNGLGCFAMGGLAAYLSQHTGLSEPMRLLFSVGLLGALTTFSTFTLDGYHLLQRGEWGILLAYLTGTIFVSFAGFAAGHWGVKALGFAG